MGHYVTQQSKMKSTDQEDLAELLQWHIV